MERHIWEACKGDEGGLSGISLIVSIAPLLLALVQRADFSFA